MPTRRSKRPSRSRQEEEPIPVTTDELIRSLMSKEVMGEAVVERLELVVGLYRYPSEDPDKPREVKTLFQANVKCRDATRPWATAVGFDAPEVFQRAMKHARAQEQGTAFYYQRKEDAEALLSDIHRECPGLARVTRVTLVPYKGWIAVVGVDPTKPYGELKRWDGQIDLQHIDTVSNQTSSLPRSSSRTATPKAPQGRTTPSRPRAPGGRSMKEMIEEYKARFGKQPNTKKFDKASLAAYLDGLRQKEGDDEGDEEDLL